MNHRRQADARSFRQLFALGLLVLGVVLPFASAVLGPARVGSAAPLPTAQLRIPTPRPAVVALAQATPNDQLAAAEQQPTTIAATPKPAAPAVEATPVTPAPAPPAEPTLTSTPIQLAPVEGGATQPIATLFPTVQAPANAP
ncbi:MAG TPA: hypothetical protein VKE41_17825, partial [Roseiflexaceae bacterium]|nr:hypothetical protein [Roseiflexaceae bacterium]